MEANNNCITSNCAFNNLCKFLNNFRKFFSIELLMVCFLVPQYLLLVPEQSFSLEQSCRVNLEISDDICNNMMNKGLTNIDCKRIGKLLNTSDFSNLDELIIKIQDTDITLNAIKVCNAESRSQLLKTKINFITSLFEYITIVVLIAAVTWSDRKGLRKPCMILPLIGYLSSHIVFLIAAIFMKQLRMEFNSILGFLLIALGGGHILMNAGVHSYIMAMFPEEERIQKFIRYAASLTGAGFITNSFAGILFRTIGYFNIILLCITIDVIGILYAIFGMEEVPAPSNAIQNCDDNDLNISTTRYTNNRSLSDIAEETDKVKGKGADTDIEETNNVVEETNNAVESNNNTAMQTSTTSVLFQCFSVFQIKKRSSSQWLIIAMLLLLFLLTLIPIFGESATEYNFARSQLGWNEIDQTYYLSYTSGIYLLGTFVYLAFDAIFRKKRGHVNISDAIIGSFSTILSLLSRCIFLTVTKTSSMYYARGFDILALARPIAVRNMLSTVVSETEWGKSFAACGVIEGISKHIGISVYSKLYNDTKDTLLNSSFYFLSFALLVTSIILFCVLQCKLYERSHQRDTHAMQTPAKRESTENEESISIENNDLLSDDQNQQRCADNSAVHITFHRSNQPDIHIEAARRGFTKDGKPIDAVKQLKLFRRKYERERRAMRAATERESTENEESISIENNDSMSHNQNQQKSTNNE